MRQPGVIALIDSVVAQVTWARRGTWIGQHDPDFLPNGNTLITESDRGRLLEVSPAGEIVWEYVNPDRGGPDNTYSPALMWGQRYMPEELSFLSTIPR
ncbi:MAG: hypothetical protein QGG67_07840 [Gammaproteobacteria bacterium]|jgi:hypothetical protein|nr:hypothetical protein [Gammaproteobacteria bacterium]MDP7270947.1 hypothetical protein [Gammaproteobacteria bacterium]HJP05426.1 hypothetical protein [Gammaproteobacteria bacterium]